MTRAQDARRNRPPAQNSSRNRLAHRLSGARQGLSQPQRRLLAEMAPGDTNVGSRPGCSEERIAEVGVLYKSDLHSSNSRASLERLGAMCISTEAGPATPLIASRSMNMFLRMESLGSSNFAFANSNTALSPSASGFSNPSAFTSMIACHAGIFRVLRSSAMQARKYRESILVVVQRD